MAEMDARKQQILRAVIFEYIRAAEPIASDVLAAKYPLGVKSATIRSELADLADLGFLEQPHTSAGRIPSDQGYRYYVDRLIVGGEPETAQKQKVKGATDEGDALQDMVGETTKLLSRLTQLLTAATISRDANLTVRSAVVSALGPKQALVVLAMSNGHVETRMVELPVELTLTELGEANDALGRMVVGATLKSAARSKAPAVDNPRTEKLLALVWGAIRSASKELNKPTMVVQGEEFLLGQPEFQRNGALLASVLDALQSEDVLADALTDGEPVTIGREHRRTEMQSLSLVRQTFFVGETAAGTIAVIGPTRMAYEQSIPLVNFTAKALSDALTRYLG